MRACKCFCSSRLLVSAVAIGMFAFGSRALADNMYEHIEFIESASVQVHGEGGVSGPPPAIVYSNSIFGGGPFDAIGDLSSGFNFFRVGDGGWTADDWALSIGTGMTECTGVTLNVAVFGGGTRCLDAPEFNSCTSDADCSAGTCQDAPDFDATVDVYNHDPSLAADDLVDNVGDCIVANPAPGAFATTFNGLSGTTAHILSVDLGNTLVGGPNGAIYVRVTTNSDAAGFILGANSSVWGPIGAGNDAEIGFSDDFAAASGILQGFCGLFFFGGVPQASFWGNLSCESGISISLEPQFASGTECVGGAADPPGSCDWYLDGPNSIVLNRPGQDIETWMYLSDWDQAGGGVNIAAYQGGLDCNGFTSGKNGTLRAPNVDNCGGGFPCNDVDTTNPEYGFAGQTVIGTCSAANLCADGTPGFIQCGTVLLVGAGAADDGVPDYGATFDFVDEGGDAAGTFILPITGDPDATFVRDTGGQPIAPIALTPAFVTYRSGACCNSSLGGDLNCVSNVQFDDCDGTWVEGVACSGVEGPVTGLDESCPSCNEDPNDDEIECDDNNACTIDDCDPDTGCTNTPDITPGFCCNPDTGDETQIDDGDQCTIDTCDPLTGQVSHTIDEGGACDDGNGCTFDDTCQADGSCAGTDTNTAPCTTIDDCPAGAQSCEGGFCVCTLETKLSLDVADSGLGDGNCFACDQEVSVDVNMGAGSECVTGGQFLVNYDPACLTFVDVTNGAFFPMLIFVDVDEVAGTVFGAVGVVPGSGNCTQGPETLATITFTKNCDCGPCDPLSYDNNNPQNTILSNTDGNTVPLDFNDSKVIRLAGDLEIDCPDDVVTNADCDNPTAIVNFDAPTASSSCEGPIDVDCTHVHSEGADAPDATSGGGEFAQGTTTYVCTATDSCGASTECSWTVDVSDQHAMDVVVQLEPVIVGNPLTRCICFEFYSDCVQAPSQWCVDLTFGGAFDFVGHATPSLKVPKGQFACLTAKDTLHTLRSVSDLECVGNTLVAEFKGDPAFDGNWLVGGNLDCWKADGNGDVIDILDFGMFVSQYLLNLDPNTPCGTAGPHSDINGDGVVDSGDFSFISRNFLASSKNSCCDTGAAGGQQAPIVSITVKELIELGFGELVVADLNRDGVLDQADMAAFVEGGVTPRRVKSPAEGGRSLGSR